MKKYQEIIDAISKKSYALSYWEKQTGINRSNLHNYLSGKKPVTFSVAQKLAACLGWELTVELKKPSYIELTLDVAKAFIGKEVVICTLDEHELPGRWAWIKILGIITGKAGQEGIGDKEHFYLQFLCKEDSGMEPVVYGDWQQKVQDYLYTWQDIFRLGSSAHIVYIQVQPD